MRCRIDRDMVRVKRQMERCGEVGRNCCAMNCLDMARVRTSGATGPVAPAIELAKLLIVLSPFVKGQRLHLWSESRQKRVLCGRKRLISPLKLHNVHC